MAAKEAVKSREKRNEDVKRGERKAWEAVFQIVSDMNYKDERELIMLLEEERGKQGFGPK